MGFSENSGLQSGSTRVVGPRLLWCVRIGKSYGGAQPQNIGERVFAWDKEDFLIVLNAMSGAVIERHTLPGRLRHKPAVIEDSVAFLSVTRSGTAQNAICAYNWQDRKLVWVQDSGGDVADLVVSRMQVFAVTRDGVVTALEKDDGSFRWSHRLRRPFWGPRLVYDGEEIYISADGKAAFGTPTYVDATKGYVLALDAVSGDLRWIYCTGGEVHHPPVLKRPRMYVGDSGSDHRHIYCLATSPKTRLGERIWRHDLGGLANCGTVVGDAAYWGCYDHHLYALDARTGSLRWRFKARGPVANNGPPCVSGDWVFAPASDGYLYGLDARDGGLRWKYFVSAYELQETGKVKETTVKVPAESELESVDAEEQREICEWLSSENREAKDAKQGGEENALPSPPDLVAWNTDSHLFLLADEGLLHCFEAPGVRQ